MAAWRALAAEPPQSVIVTSGTGSGKTECFLIPVLNDLARQRRAQTRLQGVQALFLYPLNALINSQRDRLTDWTTGFGKGVRFCLYNGNTPLEVPEDKQRLYPSEVLSRKLLRRDPPPILVTNITMLEYMLVRAIDEHIVASSRGRLRWIVLDEAHTYIGSQAAEISLLLRRVLRAFGMSPEEVRFVATSATIGDDDKDDDELRKFLADIAGTPPERVALIKGERAVPPLSTISPKMTLPDSESLIHLSPEEVYSRLAESAPMRRLRQAMTGKPVRFEDAVAILGRDSASDAQPDRSGAVASRTGGAGATRRRSLYTIARAPLPSGAIGYMGVHQSRLLGPIRHVSGYC
jgi:DEAD/DEAH box helicase domain-containing protein